MGVPLASVVLVLLLCQTAQAACPQVCSCNSHHIVKCANKSLTAVPPNIPDDTEVLDLSDSGIRDLQGLADQYLPRLNELTLTGNQLSNIPDRAFVNFVSLRQLNLPDNRIRLRKLYLQSNNIKQLSGEMFWNLTSLTEINMADNPFHCDCAIDDLREWVAGKALFKDKIICASPELMRGRPLDTVYPDQLAKMCQNASLFDASAVVGSFFGGFLLAVVAYVVVVVVRRRRLGKKKPRSGDFGKLEEEDT
ncbi:leucine-rich repeat-containing protein 3-like [Branchiostoma lanceolatum]|uniref:leucine-rich repeat-containing protein 3-like n=1 Tax=Branchiostoma lanceolatum TaxID=7740 RepID=UPI00345258E8